MKIFGGILALALLLPTPALGSSGEFPDEAAIRAELRAFIDAHRGAPGVVVGILDSRGRRVIGEGTSGRVERPRMDGATRFEIGSITKTFTGVLLADMLLSGEVSAGQRVGELFPSEIPLSNGVENATLEQLATHSSGLPRLSLDPGTVARLLSTDPYRGSDAAGIFRSVANAPAFQLNPPGGFAYSNLGFALLGKLLERRAGQPYESLLRGRVLEPLGLGGIGTAHSNRPPMELARGHGPGGRPAPYWHTDGYAPAGCLLATTDELLEYLSRQLAAAPPSVAEAQRSRRTLRDGSGIALGWMHDSVAGRRVIWHNGGTGGFRSYAGFLPDEQRGLVVLANGQGDVDALAMRLLDPKAPPLPAHERSAFGLAITICLLSWGPLHLIGPILGVRGAARSSEAGAVPPSPPSPQAVAPTRSRRQSPRLDRIDLLQLPLSFAIALVLAERVGAWRDIPFLVWWITLGLTAAGYGWLIWHARSAPWRRPGMWSTIGRGVMVAFSAAVLWLLFL